MDNYTPLNSMMHEHMLDLQSQFERAHRNTKTEECNKIARDIAIISIAQSLTNLSEILTRYTPNDILSEDDREEDLQI
jgi:hypothetical protein